MKTKTELEKKKDGLSANKPPYSIKGISIDLPTYGIQPRLTKSEWLKMKLKKILRF